jgi:hypothetical protein
MMGVHLQVSLTTQRQIHDGMFGEKGEHVIEKRYAGPDLGLAGAIQVESQRNTRFAGNAVNSCPTRFHPLIKLRLCEETKRKSSGHAKLSPVIVSFVKYS